MKCDRCKGKKIILKKVHGIYDHDDDFTIQQETCPECRGVGDVHYCNIRTGLIQ